MKIIEKFKTSGENSKIVVKNVIGALVVKGLSLIVAFITTPLFIHYFNDNKVLGVWYTLLSVLIWFLNFDLGIGNGIRNNLVKALTERDMVAAKKVISSGMFSVAFVAIILSIIGTFLISLVDLNWLFNIDNCIISSRALFLSTICVFIAVMLRFFLTTISSIFYALQKSAINNFLGLCVSLLQLLYIFVFKFTSSAEALVYISFAYIFLSNLPVLIAGIFIFCKDLKQCRPSFKYVKKSYIRAIMRIGTLFFICQILYMIIANTNEFFITNLYGTQYTAEYTFYYKLSTICSMIVSLSLAPIWSVVTKAQAEGNYVWLNKLYKKIKLGGIGILVVQLAFVPLIPCLMDIWLGKGVVMPNYIIATIFALFSTTFLYSGMLSTIANGLAMMKTQTLMFTIAVVLKVALLLLLYKYTTWSFVVCVNIIILMPYIVAQQYALNKLFKEHKTI